MIDGQRIHALHVRSPEPDATHQALRWDGAWPDEVVMAALNPRH